MDVVYDRRGSGTPLVLLHGMGHRWQAWEPVLDLLAAEHDVIAMDLLGFGQSPPMPPGRSYTMPDAVDMVAEVFHGLGVERPHVAGNSLGGAIALELAQAGRVASATAISPAGFATALEIRYALTLLALLRLAARSPAPLRHAVIGSATGRRIGGGMVYVHGDRQSEQAMSQDMDALARAAGYRPVARAGRSYRFTGRPEVPVTVGWGAHDRILVRRQARRAAARLPRARHVPIPDAGHVAMLDAPEFVTRLILDTCRAAETGDTPATI